ncbi:MAG: cytochrome c [Pseudomonadota bacterium]
MRVISKFLLSAVTALAVTGPAVADVEKTIEHRQSLYQVIAWNFGPLRGMAQGKIDFDADEAELRATRIAQISLMLDEVYTDSDTASGSDAKDEIWENWDDFEMKLANFKTEAATLATVAATGDADATKAQFGKMAGTCKACHDDYKD